MRVNAIKSMMTASELCINLSWSGYRNGEYEPYVKHSYPLDSSLTLRGIPKLVDGKIQYDGDVYHSEGAKDERYDIVDLGSLNWLDNGAITGGRQYYAVIQDKAYGTSNIVCQNMAVGNSLGEIYGRSDSNIITVKSSIEPVETFKAAMDGVMLVYELATPTTSQAEPFTSPQICDDFGTEEYITSGIPVGHETKYPANLRDKLQHLPNLANADGDYIIRQSNNDMVLVPIPTTAEELPDAPTTDGNYVLKCSVADGEVTYTWESEE
jgi:hypothetical protein